MNILDKKNGKGWNFKSVGDVLENGASFNETGSGFVKPNYSPEEIFPVNHSSHCLSGNMNSQAPLQCW